MNTCIIACEAVQRKSKQEIFTIFVGVETEEPLLGRYPARFGWKKAEQKQVALAFRTSSGIVIADQKQFPPASQGGIMGHH